MLCVFQLRWVELIRLEINIMAKLRCRISNEVIFISSNAKTCRQKVSFKNTCGFVCTLWYLVIFPLYLETMMNHCPKPLSCTTSKSYSETSLSLMQHLANIIYASTWMSKVNIHQVIIVQNIRLN